ncbi:MAG: glycosyltransferase family 1 protein [Desulfobacteraceae bacterium]|nr:MAG: glycosyltransferase family 1 protein [Desulfobacteraceae bacterium]
MTYRVLCITDKSDLPETELFIGLKNTGVDIEVMCNPDGKHYGRLRQSGVPAIDLVLKNRLDFAGVRRIKAQLKIKSYDILYCFNNPAAATALMASRGEPCKIITYRGVAGNVGFLSPGSWMTHLHPRVKRIVCVSNSVKSYFLSLHFLWFRLNPQKPVTIYKGHDLSWYGDPPADLNQFGIPNNAFVIGFAGRNRPNRGLNYIVDAAKLLPEDAPIHFLFLGKLTDDMKLRQQIDQSPYRDRIHLAGFRNDAPAIAGACDTFILPSVFKEGLSRAVIEAMAYGTPPIVTNIGGHPELVIHNESGLVVPPKDPAAISAAILDFYHDPAKKKRLGENARIRIKTRFNIKSTVADTRRLFEEVLSSPSG